MPILRPEERLGSVLAQRYRLDRILGKGGMGVVFAGTHTWTNRPIAVKLLLPQFAENNDVLQRFFQEARAAAALHHPHVIDVIDMGEDDEGEAFIVLEYLDGEPMSAMLKREGALDFGTLLELVLPVMDALAEAHARGILHRDLKPDNVFVVKGLRGRKVPKLLDFGIAKLLESQTIATGTGGVLGTPHYMAPEQARGDKGLDARADVWSMGVVCFQALTGKLPFVADTPTVVLVEIMTKPAPPLRDVAPGVHPAAAAVVDRALAADRDGRFASMAEMMTALIDAALAMGLELDARLLEYRDREAPAGPATRPSGAGRAAEPAPAEANAPEPPAPAPVPTGVSTTGPTLDATGPTADLRAGRHAAPEEPGPTADLRPARDARGDGAQPGAASAPASTAATGARDVTSAPVAATQAGAPPAAVALTGPLPGAGLVQERSATAPRLAAPAATPAPKSRLGTCVGLGLGALVLLGGLFGLLTYLGPGSHAVQLANDSQETIARVYLRRAGQTDWGADRLGGAALGPGSATTFDDIECANYDVRLVDPSGAECVMTGEWICSGASPYRLSESDVESCRAGGAAPATPGTTAPPPR